MTAGAPRQPQPAPAVAAYPDVSGGGVPYVPDDQLCAAPGHVVGSWCVMPYDPAHMHQDEQGRKWGVAPDAVQPAPELAAAEVRARHVRIETGTPAAATPGQAALKLAFENWYGSQGYDEDARFDMDEMEFAFEAGAEERTRAAIAAQQPPAADGLYESVQSMAVAARATGNGDRERAALDVLILMDHYWRDPNHEPGLSECGCRECDPDRHGLTTSPQSAPGLAAAMAALLADRNQLREALRRITLGNAGDPSVAADKALTVSRDLREQWEPVIERAVLEDAARSTEGTEHDSLNG